MPTMPRENATTGPIIAIVILRNRTATNDFLVIQSHYHKNSQNCKVNKRGGREIVAAEGII